ncbi:MAG: ABC transporter ATP-binding protein [Candidatus Marinimicrobia bacterium]|nr:ABC transporter ATP-binding protein [Candidatus Neomarinimicrobiota bacterium]MDD5582981.1 ABC transporter ATP-binding protein [Candidatus Neomarinimicrobiota bacterium]
MFKRLVKTAAHYWPLSLSGFLFSLLYALSNTASMWIIASLIQTIFEPQKVIAQTIAPTGAGINEYLKSLVNQFIIDIDPLQALNRLSLLIVAIFLLKNIFLILKQILFGHMELKIVVDTRNKLYSHITQQPMAYLDKHKQGDFISIIMNDVLIFRQAIKAIFDKLLTEPINILFTLFLLLTISWEFTLYVLIMFPIAIFIFWIIGASIRRKGRRSLKQIGVITSFLQQMLGAFRLIKSYNKEKDEIRNFKDKNRKFFKIQMRQIRLSAINSPLSEMVGVVTGALLFMIGGKMVLTGSVMDSEDFIRYIILLFSILSPVKNLTSVNESIQNGMAAGERIFNILETPVEKLESPHAIEKKTFDKEIEFRDVSFRYEFKNVLNDINLIIPKGKSYALVGSSGSGKSTIADLLCRFYTPQEGKILIDGIDIRDIKADSLYRLIGVVSQDVQILNETILANIMYGSEDANENAVKKAIEIANARFIYDFEEGLDTIAGDQGVRLSGGQKQRIAIARAVLRNSPILILDEATSSLDIESERLVQEALNQLMKGRTSLIIAHRLSTILDADQIVVLKRGRIISQGTHAELLQTCHEYKKLYKRQIRNDIEET